MLWLAFAALIAYLLWKYSVVIISKVLSVLAKCKIRVGSVGFLRIRDVNVRLPQGLSVHVDICSLQIDSNHPSRLFVLRCGDVRIEGESRILTRRESEGKAATSSEKAASLAGWGRLTLLAQYGGLFVNRVHLVLLEVVPECMVHVTVDELSVETFRSREGWQLETNCRLIQGKMLRRSGPSGRLLAEFSFPLQLSVDIVASRFNKIVLRVADPCISFSNGIFDIFQEFRERRTLAAAMKTEESAGVSEEPPSEPLLKIDWQLQLSVEIQGVTVKYTGDYQEESRYATLSIREVSVGRFDDNFQLKLSGFALVDQLQKSAVRTSFLEISISEAKETEIVEISLFSDSMQTMLSLHDAMWWRNHADFLIQNFSSHSEKSKSERLEPQRDLPKIVCQVQLAAVSCDFQDFENIQSTLCVDFLSLVKREDCWEVGVEALSFCSASASDENPFPKPNFEQHYWGQSVFIGAALVEIDETNEVPQVTIGIDDVKVEWSEQLSKQINDVVSIAKSGSPKKEKKKERSPIALRVTTNRAVVIAVAHETSFLALLAEKLVVESVNVNSGISTLVQGFRALVCASREDVVDVNGFRTVTREDIVAPQPREVSPSRRWNQSERDRSYTEKREDQTEKLEKTIRLCSTIDEFRFALNYRSPVITELRFFFSCHVFISWSPILHLILLHARKVTQQAFPSASPDGSAKRKVPRKSHFYLCANGPVEVEMQLARSHRILWQGDSLNFQLIEGQLTTSTNQLKVVLNSLCIITAVNVMICSRPSDEAMTASRIAFASLDSEVNKVWTWAAEKLHYRLPFEFNFAQVFDEFVNIFKWIKLVHEVKKKPFTAESPLPSDIRIEFKEVILELEDDDFETRLQQSHELKQDEVYECERRSQILQERLIALKKTVPLISKETIDEIMASLLQKNSEIYIQRWNRTELDQRPLFISKWTGWSMRAFADKSLHGTDRCVELMKIFDPLSEFPEDGLQFSTLWARAVEFDLDEWTINFKDYSMKYLDAKDLHFFGTLVGAETFQEGGRSLRESSIPVPSPWSTHVIQRNMSPLKFYYDLQCASTEFTATYGPCWEPCLSMISLNWNNISAPSKDPSPPLPFWDKMRLLLHGRLLWSSEKMVTTMLASTDPYNETETVEWCWDDFGLDWALGEVRVKSGLRVFMRTASRYDDSRVLMLPDVRLKILLGWVCAGDPNDHHSVVYCSPQRLPHYSSVDQHDSFRSFRSSSVNVTFNFEVSPGSCTSAEKMPNVLLYANTFRCIEQLLKTLTMKNRNVRRGRVFGNWALLKPQLSKHFGKMQVSVTLPKFFVTYWMSHSSAFGFRVFSDGLQMTASFRQSVQHSSLNREMNVRRRKVYSWEVQHMTCTLWATQVHVYGTTSAPPPDGVPIDETFLLGFSRVQYARETYPGKEKETPVHKLTAYDLKMSWTAENRNSCLTIADGVHRAHMLRRILSNDAVKILNVHLEEEEASRREKKVAELNREREEANKAHRRGYSMSDANQWMLTQLIEEAGTKLVAHCEQATDVPIDSLVGVQQCTADDVRLLNWQVDLFNSQLVLKGCERDGFLLVSAAKAQLLQNVHRSVWRSGLLLSKKSWSALLSGMQYFAPISVTGENKQKFRWLPREVIEERVQDTGFADDFVQKFSASGEAVGGVVQPETSNGEKSQLQRIVSRCSCQIYFCYFSDELKTETSEDIAVPKVEESKRVMAADEIGVDCLTLKHNMLEATSNSEQYEMVVDIVNNLVLFVDPNKKELAEKRRRLRFESQIMDMGELRQKIMRFQSDLREIVSVVRYLERQIFYLHQEQEPQNDDSSLSEDRRKSIETEMEEKKQLMLVVSDQLATYISCFKQRQVNASKAEVQEMETDASAPLVRRFEVCFEDCIWKLTENDGQIALAQTQIRNFLYTRTIRMENSGEHLFEIGSIRVTNLLPEATYPHTLHRDDSKHLGQPAIRLFVRDMPPVGGICVKEHFELNISPMVVGITHRLFDKMMQFFFPGRNIHNQENLDSNEGEASKFSFTRRIANTWSMRSNKSQNEKKVSYLGKTGDVKDDIDRMRERADQINHFLYIKIPEVSFVVSYKGNKEKNLTDVDRFNFLFPLCEFHEKNWTWLDLALAVKQRCKRVLLQQFMRQKLLRNRLTGGPESPLPQGFTEEEKKRIAVGMTSAVEKKRKK
ncbi:unnamed protein product [Caenorhabditis auriculariae]|uniref:FMP27/BLTP2/Hobbit GFWDK motif-containing RBG unit domain-containing protein n=1 Tax=Caenorhabditis auriculariae TaxID=2777116 RepID=A0A8S1H8R7_9PELO|nr:unnamed protein product [Caenorhabditis auriculariae]